VPARVRVQNLSSRDLHCVLVLMANCEKGLGSCAPSELSICETQGSGRYAHISMTMSQEGMGNLVRAKPNGTGAPRKLSCHSRSAG
jgi:hypothetical protein